MHFLAGITWIGILYYFNFIQTPFFGSELGGGAKGAMTRGLVPNALWWFRWGAMFTFITGILILATKLGHDGVPDERVVIFNTGAAQKYVEAITSPLPKIDITQPIDWDKI